MSTPQDPQSSGSAPQPDDDAQPPTADESIPKPPGATADRPNTDRGDPPRSVPPEPEGGDTAAAGEQEARPNAPTPPGGTAPGGEVPPQAWSAHPTESKPGQAWSTQPSAESGTEQSPTGGPASGSPADSGAQPNQPWWGDQPGSLPSGTGPGYPTGGTFNYPPTPGATGTPGGGYSDTGYDPGSPYAQGGQPYPQGGPQYDKGSQPHPQDAPGYGSTPYGPGGEYPSYPQQSYTDNDSGQRATGTQTYSIIGFVCAAVCLFFCPILFGPAGIILGVVGHSKGETLGRWAAIAAGAGMILGLVLSFALYNSNMMLDT